MCQSFEQTDFVPSFDPAYFARLTAADRTSFWYRGRYALIDGAIRRFAPDASSLLDVGCGTGGLLAFLAKSNPSIGLRGVDPFVEAVIKAKERVPRADIVVGDVLGLEEGSRSDVVTALDVLEHVEDHVEAMRRLAREVRPGGLLLLLAPQHPKLWSQLDEVAGHRRRYAPGELSRLAERAGLHVLRASSFVTAVLPIAALVRTRRSNDPLAGLLPPRLINAAFEWSLKLEARFVLAGGRLPIGLSSFVAAIR